MDLHETKQKKLNLAANLLTRKKRFTNIKLNQNYRILLKISAALNTIHLQQNALIIKRH